MKKYIGKKEKSLEESKKDVKTSDKMIAKGDFHIIFNDFNIKIKKDDDVYKSLEVVKDKDLKTKFITNLKTEKII